MRPWVLASSSLAPALLIGGWTLAASRQPAAYDATRDTISALAMRDAVDPWVMTAALAGVGACHVATAVGLDESARLGRLLLAAGGVATALVAAFPQPSAGHFPAATASFLTLAVWPAASRLPGRRSSALATVGLLGLLGWLALELDGGRLLGLSERVVAGAESLWPLLAVLAVRRTFVPSPTRRW